MSKHEHPGVWVEPAPVPRPETVPGVMIRHPSNPFIRPWDGSDAQVYELAREYVNAFAAAFRLNTLDPRWLEGLSQRPLGAWKPERSVPRPGEVVLRWLPLGGRDARDSFWVHRSQKGARRQDRSGVLLAALSATRGSTDHVYLGPTAFRLRVVFHVFEEPKQDAKQMEPELKLRFTGMSRSFGEPDALELDIEGEFKKPKDTKPRAAQDVEGHVFPLDPASAGGVATLVKRRPNRPSADLKPATRVSLGRLQVHANRAALKTPEVEVLGSYFVPPDHPLPQTKTVAVNQVGGKWEVVESDPRKNDFAAVSAFYHCSQMVGHIHASGLGLDDYFRCAERPVWLAYRSGISRSRDGRTRNADAVWATLPELDATPLVKGEIMVRYALGDGFLPGSHLPTHAYRERYPLGIAADVRWNCHEFGHVLLMAAVGEREFRFAHSAGDSLAAILCDPKSSFTRAGWRGVTFPWVGLTRRHDRRPEDGWAWGGALDNSHHGYWKEQILSSTLFRLYQTLGGDAVTGSGLVDEHARRAASDHAIFLIVRAIGLMGAADIVAASSPDQFVSALMDADTASDEFVTSNCIKRIGGNAHKVVRWAFERQGLYPAAGAPKPPRGPGDAPAVDVFIASPLGGGYSWDVPAYDITVNNPRKDVSSTVRVVVGNRGANAAAGTNVALWAARANAGIPDWRHPKWQQVDSKTLIIAARDPGTPVNLSWTPAHTGAYALLAIASCEEDRANTVPATGYSCAINGSPIPQLLTGDNNIGLYETTVKP